MERRKGERKKGRKGEEKEKKHTIPSPPPNVCKGKTGSSCQVVISGQEFTMSLGTQLLELSPSPSQGVH